MFINEIREMLAADIQPRVWDWGVEILGQETVDESRWTRRVRYVVRKELEVIAIEWDEGLTEYQDVDELNGEAYYVKPEVVKVTKWVRRNDLD
jgi:hypothetical protein